MKRWHDESEGFSNIKNKQTQIHVIALIASIIVLVLGLIALPYMIYAQNTNSTPSNATIAESGLANMPLDKFVESKHQAVSPHCFTQRS
jgi:flagellar basal body-associated protein FliL